MPMPTLLVEAGFAVGASTSTYFTLDDPVRGKLDTGTLAPDVVWTDISAYAMALPVARRGVSRVDGPVLRYEAGRAQLVLNDSDRRFDPSNLSGPYVSGGVTQVKPLVAVRIRVTYGSTTYDVWRGFAESWVANYHGPNLTTCTLSCVDAVKLLSADDRAASASTGAGDDTGARIDRILNSVSWPATDRIIATGNSTLQATTLAGKAWPEMQAAAESEIGELYIDAAGRVVFRNRLAVLVDARSNTSQATFGDGGGAELPYEDVTGDYSDDQLYNKARITRAGGAEQTASDATSIAQYLTHTYPNTDLLLETDGAALDYAGWVVSQAKDPEQRFDSLQIFALDSDPVTEALKMAQVFGREIGDRITVIRRPPGGGTATTREVIIRGIEHRATPSDGWRTTFALQSATRLQFLVLDHSTLGRLDSNALGF